MALANTNVIDLGAVDTAFVPELWSDEVVAAYKSNLVFANLVRKLNHKGKKGDTIYIPQPSRSTANRRATITAGYDVVPLAYAETTRLTVSINKHTEYSRLFDDLAEVQALESLRRFFTDDAGYAIAQAVDIDLIGVMIDGTTGATPGTTDYISSLYEGTIDASVVSYTADSFLDGDGTAINALNALADAYVQPQDAGIRAAVRILDLADVPMSNRHWAVRPETKEDLMGVARFTEDAFVGDRGSSNTIRNGLIGDVYGVDVYVTNQLPNIDASDSATVIGEVSLMFHSDSTVLVEQMGVRTQRQYQQQYLADLVTTDCIYGVANLRTGSIVPMLTGAATS